MCWNNASCTERWETANALMSSNTWNKQSMQLDGIFDSNPQYNPQFYNANLVYVPYCSSDSWSGNSQRNASATPWIYRGTRIIKYVVQDMLQNHGLNDASMLVMGGCSSGARGALYNIDSVCSMLNPKTKCLGFHDAVWWADIPPLEVGQISLYDALVDGAPLWNGSILMNKCGSLETLTPAEFALCYFADNAVGHVATQILVHTEQYDAFQIPYDIGHNPPYNTTEMTYIANLRNVITTTLAAAIHPPNKAWSAACFQHCVSQGSTFWTIQETASGKTLQQALFEFIKYNDTTSYIDSCSSFNCSPGCPSVPSDEL